MEVNVAPLDHRVLPLAASRVATVPPVVTRVLQLIRLKKLTMPTAAGTCHITVNASDA